MSGFVEVQVLCENEDFFVAMPVVEGNGQTLSVRIGNETAITVDDRLILNVLRLTSGVLEGRIKIEEGKRTWLYDSVADRDQWSGRPVYFGGRFETRFPGVDVVFLD
jgi:hypothetical protein